MRQNPAAPLVAPHAAQESWWRLGETDVDLTSGQLRRGDADVGRLDRGSLAVLARVLAEPGATVGKAQLLEAGWPGRVVTENSLTKAIARLRAALADADATLIQSVHGYGYRVAAGVSAKFTLAVPSVATSDPDMLAELVQRSEPRTLYQSPTQPPNTVRPWYGRPVPWLPILLAIMTSFLFWHRLEPAGRPAVVRAKVAARPPAVLLLPIRCVCTDQADELLAKGIELTLSDLLARLPDIVFTGPDALPNALALEPDLRELGRAYGVQHVLIAHLLIKGTELDATLQLHDTTSGRLLWSTVVTRPRAQLFELEGELQRALLKPLGVTQSPPNEQILRPTGTHNLAAYQQFLAGMALYRSDDGDPRRAVQAFRQAVELDAGYDQARLQLAKVLGHNGFYADNPEEALRGKREALEIVDAVLARTPRNVEALLLRGAFRYAHWWDWVAAEADFAAAQAMGADSNYMLALDRARVAAATGQQELALSFARRADLLQPRWQFGASLSGYVLLAQGRFDEARRALDRAIKANGADEHAHYYLGLCDLLQQQFDEARVHFENSAHVLRLTGLAALEFSRKNGEASEQALATLVNRYAQVDAFRVAQVHAWRGETDAAFQWLDRAVVQHEASLMYLQFDPLLAHLRNDPRYQRVLAAVHLSPGH